MCSTSWPPAGRLFGLLRTVARGERIDVQNAQLLRDASRRELQKSQLVFEPTIASRAALGLSAEMFPSVLDLRRQRAR